MGIKEQVKQGQLTPQEAMARVSKDSHTYGWCKRRQNKGIKAPITATPEVPVSDEKPKNKYKKKNYQKPKKS